MTAATATLGSRSAAGSRAGGVAAPAAIRAGRPSPPLPVALFLALTVLVPVEYGLNVGPLFFTRSKA